MLASLYNYPYRTMGDFFSHRFLALHQSTSSSILVLHCFNSCWKQEGTMGQRSVATSHQTKPPFITLIIFFLFFLFFHSLLFWGLGHGNWHGVWQLRTSPQLGKENLEKRGKIETRGFLWLTLHLWLLAEALDRCQDYCEDGRVKRSILDRSKEEHQVERPSSAIIHSLSCLWRMTDMYNRTANWNAWPCPPPAFVDSVHKASCKKEWIGTLYWLQLVQMAVLIL